MDENNNESGSNENVNNTPATETPAAEPTTTPAVETTTPVEPASTETPAADESASTDTTETPAAEPATDAGVQDTASTDTSTSDTTTTSESNPVAPAAATSGKVKLSLVADGKTVPGEVDDKATVADAYKSLMGKAPPARTTFRANGASIAASARVTAGMEVTAVANASHG